KRVQLANVDLGAYVEGGLERNPLLERVGDGESDRPAAGVASSPAPEPAPADWVDDGAGPDRAPDRLDAGSDDAAPADVEAAPSRPNGEWPTGYSDWAGGARDSGDYNIEAFLSVETTLADHLSEQLALAVVDPARRMIGQFLIDLVDEAGYLSN